MTSPTPRAYSLAASLRPDLLTRYNIVEKDLSRNGYSSNILAVQEAISSGTVGINMSIPSCIRVLKKKRWFNIYEVVSSETGKKGKELEKEVRKRIPSWYTQRRTIDKLFKFRRDTHYATLNIGGPGALRYGVCCVKFDLTNWDPYHTCFGGDSIRACFDSNGQKVANDEIILQTFAIGTDADKIAIIKHKSFLRELRPGLDILELCTILESSDSLIEFHLHGEVTADHLKQVCMSKANRDRFWELAKRAQELEDPLPQEYDVVPHFLELLKLLKEQKIKFFVTHEP